MQLCELARAHVSWPLEQARVSTWETGAQRPGWATRLLLQQITLGAVAVEMWAQALEEAP